jgi:hypothetical protein
LTTLGVTGSESNVNLNGVTTLPTTGNDWNLNVYSGVQISLPTNNAIKLWNGSSYPFLVDKNGNATVNDLTTSGNLSVSSAGTFGSISCLGTVSGTAFSTSGLGSFGRVSSGGTGSFGTLACPGTTTLNTLTATSASVTTLTATGATNLQGLTVGGNLSTTGSYGAWLKCTIHLATYGTTQMDITWKTPTFSYNITGPNNSAAVAKHKHSSPLIFHVGKIRHSSYGSGCKQKISLRPVGGFRTRLSVE